MNLSRYINLNLVLLLLYESLIEAKPGKLKKITSEKITSEKSTKTIGKHKRKKQFFPAGGHASYPGSYPIPQLLKPADSGQMKVKFTKGFPPPYDCTRAKYGCCWDGRTPAHGEAGKGCPRCRDVYDDFCKKTKNLCHFPMVADYCRITCKLCSKKKNHCQKGRYNCCWDGVTSASGHRCKGCPKIKDKLGKECEKFEAECLRNPYFMWTKCRESCLKYLPPIEPFLQISTQSNDMGLSPPHPSLLGVPPPPPPTGISFPYPIPGASPTNNTLPLGKKTSANKNKKG